MNVTIKKISFEESILEVETKSGIKELVINKTGSGYSYKDFAEWDITDEQYYALEDLVDDVINLMSGHSELNVFYDC
ncbi:hypothetical protein ACTHHL_04655 [Aeribacillus composti]|uniref:hypothetical protein n=1 Tax=Aeribacillus composti TaxID=1868734 RepID=UPI00406A4492